VQAREVHIHEIQAREVRAYEVQVREVRSLLRAVAVTYCGIKGNFR
jgi:hypothetical protein